MQTGDVIAERFEVEREVATGGMGRIYRARDRQEGGLVAVKLLTQQSPRLRSRLLREAAILAEIHHPGIVRYIAHGPLDGDMVYLVMEWLEGEDLGQYLTRRPQEPQHASNQSGELAELADALTSDTVTLDPRSILGGPGRSEPFTVAEAVTLGRRLSSAVAELHRRGIVHRDIKPSNLFLAEGALDQIKLLDFGTAYQYGRADHLTRRGAIVGTPHYMAPEQARAGGIITPATDIWAIGCVLYRSLTGARPFEGNDVVAVLTRILLEPPVPITIMRPDLPPALAEIIMQSLEKDASLRPADAGEVLAALESLTGTDESSAPRSWPPVATPALTSAESRVTCMLFADFSRTEHAEEDTLAHLTQPLSAQLQTLADGTVLVTIPHVRLPGDQAARAARVALAVQCEYPDLRMVLATGRTMETRSNDIAMRLDVDAAVQAMHSAAAGRIELDATTAAALGSRFMIVREDGRAYLGPERDHEAARTLLGKPSRWVGRRSELATLMATFDECAEDRVARAVVITASAGMGKSRLREEFVRTLHSRGEEFLLIAGAGDPVSAGAPLSMLAPALRSLAGILDGEDPRIARRKLRTRIAETVSGETLSRVLPFVGEMIGVSFADENDPDLRTAMGTPAAVSERMREAWQIFVRGECARRPVLILLDDLHWGDLLSVSYVDAVLEALRDRPLMVVALGRPEVKTLFPQLWTRRDILDMSLAPLSARAAALLVRDVLGDRVSDEIIDRIVRRAGGNAFYLEELIRSELESDSGEVPETVLGMVQARLDALGAEAKRILRAASVFGETFWRAGVEALLGPGGTFDVGSWLDELTAREFIQRVAKSRLRGQREYVFRHTLVREAAHAMLTEEDRRLGHVLAADWLHQAGEDDDVALANHYLSGGEVERAVSHYQRAAQHAFEAGRHEDAITHAQRAVDVGARGATLGELRTLQTAACYFSDRYLDCIRFGSDALALTVEGSGLWFRSLGFAAAASILENQGPSVQRWIAALLEARCESGAESEQIASLCQAAQQLINRGLDPETAPLLARLDQLERDAEYIDGRAKGQLSGLRAAHAWLRGSLQESSDLLHTAVRAFQSAGETSLAILERNTLATLEYELGRYDHALALAEENLTLLRAHESKTGVHFARVTAAACMAQKPRRRVAAREMLQTSIATYRTAHKPFMLGYALVRLAWLEHLEGNTAAAATAAGQGVDCFEDSPRLTVWALAVRARTLLSLGRPSDALSCVQRLASLRQPLAGLSLGATLVPLVVAQVHAANGDHAAARLEAAAAAENLQARGATLRDPAAREAFLAVPTHREIVALAHGGDAA
ncbi:serine/threonine-protein kinase PknK [Haliangium ochraceum]|uniref:Serine/threonine protein kinase n=1 Tax=Haliangium ochraceum (strain DSM 14365 / JCM 11303 / SMP-2) TaxID=502025 RepID=D0LNA0_HALO1|nr:serine/threonine-protein kinase [Haliangium ochraceum]ACY15277.1 serine/threonine protein kinase [Haliangium ochraceum DSM 14365]